MYRYDELIIDAPDKAMTCYALRMLFRVMKIEQGPPLQDGIDATTSKSYSN